VTYLRICVSFLNYILNRSRLHPGSPVPMTT
jgi:hypothetical protein